MMKIKAFLKKNLVLSYFVLAFLISWGGSLLGGGASFMRGEKLEPIDVLPMGVAMLLGPFISGIVMTYIDTGRNGVKDLFAGMKIWKGKIIWYGAALDFPILILLVLLPLSTLVTKELSPTFFPIGIILGTFAGLMEETGWMGFAYPRMRSKHGVLRAAIILGILHAVWHILADFLGNFNNYGAVWLPYFASFSLFVIALRVVIVYVYEKTDSLFLAQLMHASSSGFLAALVPMGISGHSWFIFYAVYAAVLSIIAAVQVIRNRSLFLDQPVKKNR
jgi:membrane protease YdiL (CAAX protease family)